MTGKMFIITYRGIERGGSIADMREEWNDFPVSTPPPVRTIDGERSVTLDENHFPDVIKKLEGYGILDSIREVTVDPVTGESKEIPERTYKLPQPAAQPQQS